jgi:hypothetical protein
LCNWVFHTTDDDACTDNYTRAYNRTTTNYNNYVATVPDDNTATADYILATDNLVATDNTATTDNSSSADYARTNDHIWTATGHLPRSMQVVYVAWRWYLVKSDQSLHSWMLVF